MTQDEKLTLINGLGIPGANKNALKDLWLEYNQSNYKGSFEQFLLRGRQYDDGINYNGVPKETLAATARTYSEVFTRSSTPKAQTNSITNGKNTQTEVKDKSSITPTVKKDLPVNSVSDATNQMAVSQEQNTPPAQDTSVEGTPQPQKTPDTSETPPAIGDNPELQEEKTKTPSTDNQDIEESEADQEPGGSGTMGVVSGRDLLNAGREEFRRLSDITSNMANNNTNQESAPVREEENVSPTPTTTTANKSDTSTPTSTPVQEEKTPTPAPTRTNTPVGQPAEMVARSGIYEQPEAPAIRPVDRGRFDYIRNNGWGSNSSILTRMGYSPEEIRRILDSSGAVRPEYFSY